MTLSKIKVGDIVKTKHGEGKVFRVFETLGDPVYCLKIAGKSLICVKAKDIINDSA